MSNEYYTGSGYPTYAAAGDSASARSELSSIQAGFDKLPILAAHPLYLTRVNAAANALESAAVGTVLQPTVMAPLVAATVHAASSKATPVDADEFDATDSASAYAMVKVTWANIKATFYATLGALIAAGTGKTTPVGADSLVIADSAASNATKTLSFTNLVMYLSGLCSAGWNASTATLATTATTATNALNFTGTAADKLPSIDCTQSGGALTFSAVAQYLDFRNVSLTNGTPSTVNCAPANLVLPSGGTLGAVTTVSARIVLVEMNNAGTAELAIANIAGGLDMSETGLISTTAIGAGSTANNVWYSTTSRTNLAYRVIGAFDVVNTAGAWGNPTTKINAGGNALTAMSSLGYGQTWTTFTSVTRALNTTYYNTKGKPIQVAIITTTPASITIGGVSVSPFVSSGYAYMNHIIPAGASYIVPTGPTWVAWAELS